MLGTEQRRHFMSLHVGLIAIIITRKKVIANLIAKRVIAKK